MPYGSTTSNVLAVIMGGGRGARLSPLTTMRSKPAVPIAGKYRLIDIPISNCINSDFYHIAVLTQFNSVSLHRHITQPYLFDAFHSGWVQIWAAEQTIEIGGLVPGHSRRGPQAALRDPGHRRQIRADPGRRSSVSHGLRLRWRVPPGQKADITVAVHPVPREEAGRLGILKVETDGRISDFVEKPQDPATVERFVSRPDAPHAAAGFHGHLPVQRGCPGIHPQLPSQPCRFRHRHHPACRAFQHGLGYGFDGYWRDIGTIRAYYETNMLMAATTRPSTSMTPSCPSIPMNLSCRAVWWRTAPDGCAARRGLPHREGRISHSVVGIRSQIATGTHIQDSVINGLGLLFARPWHWPQLRYPGRHPG